MTSTLTIAIPTYSRKVWLAATLSNVLSQVESLGDGRVDVLVVENAGNDGSWEYLQELSQTHPRLRIHRNATNLGAEGNFYRIPELCTAPYLWLLGDDDHLRPGAIAAVLAHIDQGCDFVAVNFQPGDEQQRHKGHSLWSLSKDLQCSGVEQCAGVVSHFAFGFISTWVARLELFNNVDKETYLHFKQWGLSLMLDRYLTVARASRGVVMAEAMGISRKPPEQEYAGKFDYFDWFFNGSARVLELLVEKGAISRGLADSRKSWLLVAAAPKRILFERSIGVLKRARVSRILRRDYAADWRCWGICMPLLYLPGLGALAATLKQYRGGRNV